MRLNNRSIASWLAPGLALASCANGAGRPLPGDPARHAPASVLRGDDAVIAPPPLPQQTALPASDEARDGPPPSTGPSATSDHAADRYDEVGYAVAGAASGYVAAVRGLPPGAYVEVTSLGTGRTALAIVGGAAPATDHLADVSPAVAAVIGLADRGAVRVRRVVPPPVDQTALANGRPPSPRLETPPVLLAGLRARLGVTPATSATPATPVTPANVTPTTPARVTSDRPARAPVVRPPPPPRRATPAAGLFVQVAAFASADRAKTMARRLGGSVSFNGSLYRVRTGPYGDAASAARARDAAAARGYGDARVVRDQ